MAALVCAFAVDVAGTVGFEDVLGVVQAEPQSAYAVLVCNPVCA